MSKEYLSIPHKTRMRVWLDNKKERLGGGFHTPPYPEVRTAADYKVKRVWTWVPNGVSTGYSEKPIDQLEKLRASCQGCWGGTEFDMAGYKCRWCEDLEGYFRKVTKHATGWYTRCNDYDEVTNGIVLTLPNRNGKQQFMIGCTDPHNEGTGIVEQEIYYDEFEAAGCADRLAERSAEMDREDDLKQRAEQAVEDIKGDIKDVRTHIKELVAGLRTSVLSDTVCKEMRKTLKGYRESVRTKIARIRKIEDEPWCLLR